MSKLYKHYENFDFLKEAKCILCKKSKYLKINVLRDHIKNIHISPHTKTAKREKLTIEHEPFQPIDIDFQPDFDHDSASMENEPELNVIEPAVRRDEPRISNQDNEKKEFNIQSNPIIY